MTRIKKKQLLFAGLLLILAVAVTFIIFTYIISISTVKQYSETPTGNIGVYSIWKVKENSNFEALKSARIIYKKAAVTDTRIVCSNIINNGANAFIVVEYFLYNQQYYETIDYEFTAIETENQDADLVEMFLFVLAPFGYPFLHVLWLKLQEFIL